MKYRSVTVRPLIEDGDIANFKEALTRCGEAPVRVSVSGKKCAISATLDASADMLRVRNALALIGFRVVEDVEVES